MYSVPTVPPDLRHEETIIQAVNSLDYLQKTITDVFDRIDARSERNNVKINDLQNRIENAHKSINSLVGINKAIKIFSPPKFPATHIFQDIPITFDSLKDPPKFSVNRDYDVVSSLDPVSHRTIQDKLVFYHVRTNMQTKNTKTGLVINQKQGMGKLPENLKSVNGLLRFHTNETVYSKDGVSEGLYGKNASTKKKDKMSPVGQRIEAPPMSMTSRKGGDKKPHQGLFYTPQLHEAPALDVPMDLPDLPGIADDITFNLNENERIAPSFYIDNLPDLPEPETIHITSQAVEKSTIVSENKPSVSSPSDAGLPPPPPPPVEVIQDQNSLPIPPPPPPPPPSVPISPSKPSTSSSTSKPTVEMTDARMNLMDAIRKTGGVRGAKLRAAAEVTKSDETGSKKEDKKPSGDLMADLHNKLLMRRKGISGAKEQGAAASTASPSGSGGVMDRISALIPPPPPKVPANANSSATDASDENDEWTD